VDGNVAAVLHDGMVEGKSEMRIVVVVGFCFDFRDVADKARALRQLCAVGQASVGGGFRDDFVADFRILAVDFLRELRGYVSGLGSRGRSLTGLRGCAGICAATGRSLRFNCESKGCEGDPDEGSVDLHILTSE
jgi:hypothetical protein